MTQKIVLVAGMLLAVGVCTFDIFPELSLLTQITAGLAALAGFVIGE